MPGIERGQFADFLRRYLSMKGEQHVADELAPEISPTLPLEVERPEWEFLKGAKLVASAIGIPAAVGQQSTYRLRNPAGSGVIAIISRVYISIATTASIVLIARNTDQGNLGTFGGTIARDTRYEATAVSALIPSFATVSFTGNQIYSQFLTLGTQLTVYEEPIVLTPGNQIEVSATSTNVDVRGAVSWLEKRLDDLEAK